MKTRLVIGNKFKYDVNILTYCTYIYRDRVAAAHLRPLEKGDFSKKASPGWNQFAATEKEIKE